MMGTVGFTTLTVLVVIIISPCIYGIEFSDEIEVQQLLKRLNKPAVKSIKSIDGDIIDCVPITSQPAFDHPLLKNHTIQMRPTFIPKADSKFTKKEANTITQAWRANGECPENTVAIKRIKKEDILRAKSIESFGKKSHQSLLRDDPADHEYAIMRVENQRFFGTKFVINTWRPAVQVSGEFSLAQTWLASGSGTTTNTIEAGWQIFRGLYGDNNIRLFVYWTRDGYQKTGCYNTLCPGFVQRSNKIIVGGSFGQASRYNGTQYDYSMTIWKGGGNWWLKIGEELVGYWPGSLFTSIGNGAASVEWGGEILNLKTGGRHTTTDMGSGHFADEWYKKASYFRQLQTVDGSSIFRQPQGIHSYASHSNCYTVKAGNPGSSYWGYHFFYGGPGRNNNCP